MIDGALFAFVTSNDPELIVRIEAVQDSDDQEAAWQYSIASMSSRKQTVQLDGTDVWSVSNYYESGRSRTGPYIEGGVGRYVPGDGSTSHESE